MSAIIAAVTDRRERVRAFMEEHVYPNEAALTREDDAADALVRELQEKARDAGLWAPHLPPEAGGSGSGFLEYADLNEEIGRSFIAQLIFGCQAPDAGNAEILHLYGTDEQKERFLQPLVAGEVRSFFGMTEPEVSGSDPTLLRGRAERDGDEWVINGNKLYITSGTQADWLCMLVRTSEEGGYQGMSQIVVPTDVPGFAVSRKLEKLGNWSSDTAELSFEDVRVPVANTIGAIGRGFQQQMAQFQNERMISAYQAVGGAERAIERTADYLRQRVVFGKPLLANQQVQFTLAELSAELDMARHYNYACADAYMRGEDTTRFATIAKLAVGRLVRKIADTCLQYHGGIGYMCRSRRGDAADPRGPRRSGGLENPVGYSLAGERLERARRLRRGDSPWRARRPAASSTATRRHSWASSASSCGWIRSGAAPKRGPATRPRACRLQI
jgi:citronellyl-CoA dehydrogenase